jgi:hypothetical protein
MLNIPTVRSCRNVPQLFIHRVLQPTRAYMIWQALHASLSSGCKLQQAAAKSGSIN